MKFYLELFKLIIKKFILRKDTGIVVRDFCCNMGIVYIKLAQILATQNYGNLFTQNDRKLLSSICDNCNPISFNEIESILQKEFDGRLYDIFSYIDKKPVGSASISQVHKAVLKTGEEVAIKIKRLDITNNINIEINRLKKLINRFGKFVKFNNCMGGKHALDLYLKWIMEEIDFEHERKNIKTYSTFAQTVNEKKEDTKQIKVPKLYNEYCTDNIIVMEFIRYKTINKIELDEENNTKINEALNSYIKLSFWALFNDEKIVFHGDPHNGNIYLDEDGNIGFLDMGLLFELTSEEALLTRKFFLTVYSGDYDKLYDILIGYGNMSVSKKNKFKEECKKYCEEIKSKDVTCYFTDMINICLKYEFVPPDFLFCMAKAFICLNGINNFSCNETSAINLLQEQILEFLLKREFNDSKSIIKDGFKMVPRLFKNTLKYGPIKSIAKESSLNNELKEDLNNKIENLKEFLAIVKKSIDM